MHTRTTYATPVRATIKNLSDNPNTDISEKMPELDHATETIETTLLLTRSLYQAVEMGAQRHNLSVPEFIRILIARYITLNFNPESISESNPSHLSSREAK